MCGGIVSALSFQPNGILKTATPPAWHLHLAYNIGRISSYAIAGAIMGGLGSLGLLLNGALPVQMSLYIAANLMMVALGLYLIGITQSLAFTERAGHYLWRRVQPYTKRFLPAQTIAQAFPLGMLWGWLPCGLVYSVLAWAFAAGSVAKGALLMLAFGAGTLPALLLMGAAAATLTRFTRDSNVKRAAGFLVVALGLLLLWRALV